MCVSHRINRKYFLYKARAGDIAQSVSTCLAYLKPWFHPQHLIKLGMVVHAWNVSILGCGDWRIRKLKVILSYIGIQGQPVLHKTLSQKKNIRPLL